MIMILKKRKESKLGFVESKMRERDEVGDPSRQAYWLHDADVDDDDSGANLKIHSVFEGVKSFPLKRIILQFWRPLTDGGGRLVLGSHRHPYALSPLDRLLQRKYRPLCIRYQYIIVDADDADGNPKPRPAWIISGGPVVAAFQNRFPEVVPDLHGSTPLAVCALECELRSCLMLPVFNADAPSECLGVVECSVKNPSLLLPLFYDLKRQLERVGMSIYNLQGTWPYKTISGDLEAAKTEIQRALEIASQSHALTLAQVWIPSHTFLVKLSSSWYYSDVDSRPSSSSSAVKDFYDNFDVISGDGLLARKTLQTRQPHLCTDIRNLTHATGVSALLSTSKSSAFASFVVCLRSSHTGDLDYAFEFFWPTDRNHFVLLDTLLFFTLTKYLPSFKPPPSASSGEQLGDHELSVVHVHSSSSSTPVKIPLGLSETKTLVGCKRKSIAAAQTDPTQSDHSPSTDQEAADDLPILATYRNQTLLFYLSISSTLEKVMEKLTNEFELDATQTYKVEYKEAAPGQWSSLASLESCRSLIEGAGLLKLRVLSNRKEAALRWITHA